MSEASLTSPSGSSLIDRHLVAAAVAAAGGGSLTVNPGHQGDNTTTTAAFAPVEQSASSPATTPAALDADLCPKPVVHSAQALVTHLHHRHPTATASSAGPATTTPTTTTSPISTPTTTFSPSFSSLLLLEPTLPDPFPLPSAASPRESLPTPIYEDSRGLDLSLGFAAAAVLPSTDVTLPTPPVLRSAHNLRLPSFDVLGIAAPHPDRISLNRSSHSFASLGTGPLSNPEDPLHALSPPLDHLSQTAEPEPVADNSCASPKAAKAQGDRIVPIVTPPSEPGTFHWGSFVNLVVRPEGLGSPPNSDPSHSPSLNTTTTTPSSLDPVSTARGPEITGIDNAVGTVSMDTWVPEVKDTIITQSGCLDLDTVRVLSHALPCPSLTGHLFGQLIAAIHDRTTTHTAWINVFHAVPGRFTLSDLPKSPPSTPGPAVGGDEYFTSKIFDSAVAIPDYQLDSKLLPPSPRPVVPPGSVNISIVERYIPPTNTNEFSEMFQFKGRSLLFDRLVELSSDNGILLFVYPTKTGGQTFMHHYLGPILDPLLRTVTVVHDLTSDLGKNLGQMRSVAHLDEYNTLKAKVVTFCDTLSTGQANPTSSKATYQVIRASREEVMLERSSWANDWWIKQEKPRVRESVTKYFRKAKKLPVNTEMTGAHLIQEVLDGVAKREYEGFEPTKGVEVGVFIIKKSK